MSCLPMKGWRLVLHGTFNHLNYIPSEMKTIRTITLLFITASLVFVQCKKEIDNPYDPATPAALWTPVSFSANQTGTTVVLSWLQEATPVSGFKIDRKVAPGDWKNIASVGEEVLSYTDTDLAGPKLHEYRIYAVAGNNQSDMTFAEITPVFPDGTTRALTYHGDTYRTVWINNREWMAVNLSTSRYRDGSSIATGLTNTQWQNTNAGAFAIFPHAEIADLTSVDGVLKAYGALYNWYAIDDSRGLCPPGWHVPSRADWDDLVAYAGTAVNAGGKLKSVRTVPGPHPRWESPNTGATDDYGFSAIPSGGRGYDGTYSGLGYFTFFWTSTSFNVDNAWARLLVANSVQIGSGDVDKNLGLSVRCLRDQ